MNAKNFLSKNLIIFSIGTVLIIAALFLIKDITLLFFTSFVLASAINPAIDRMSKKMPRWIAVLIFYLLGFIVIALCLVPLINIVFQQFIVLLQNAPVYGNKIYSLFTVILHKIPWITPVIFHFSSAAANYSQNILASSINITMNLMTGLVIVFTLAMIVLYMLLDKDHLKTGFLKFFPLTIREKTENISETISKKVGGYVVGQLFSMFAVGVLFAFGLMIIKVNFAVLLGSLTGVLDIIPVVGPAIALILALLVAFAQSPLQAIWVVVVFLIVQWITNTFLRPAIFSKFLDLHPLTIIFALLVSAAWLGVIGVIIAPAIAATVCVLVDELYLKNINPD